MLHCSVCCVMIVHLWFLLILFFFFKQKTAYEMRISDWSSDVCSSDLIGKLRERGHHREDDERAHQGIFDGGAAPAVPIEVAGEVQHRGPVLVRRRTPRLDREG